MSCARLWGRRQLQEYLDSTGGDSEGMRSRVTVWMPPIMKERPKFEFKGHKQKHCLLGVDITDVIIWMYYVYNNKRKTVFIPKIKTIYAY